MNLIKRFSLRVDELVFGSDGLIQPFFFNLPNSTRNSRCQSKWDSLVVLIGEGGGGGGTGGGILWIC